MTVTTVMILLLGSYNFCCSISTTTAINPHKSSTITDIFFVPEYTEDFTPSPSCFIAGGAMRAVLESAGITDVLAKSKGSSNPHNVVKATIAALGALRDPHTVSQQRSVPISKVFNG